MTRTRKRAGGSSALTPLIAALARGLGIGDVYTSPLPECFIEQLLRDAAQIYAVDQFNDTVMENSMLRRYTREEAEGYQEPRLARPLWAPEGERAAIQVSEHGLRLWVSRTQQRRAGFFPTDRQPTRTEFLECLGREGYLMLHRARLELQTLRQRRTERLRRHRRRAKRFQSRHGVHLGYAPQADRSVQRPCSSPGCAVCR